MMIRKGTGNNSGILVLEENGREVILYRCLLHDPSNPHRHKIRAGKDWTQIARGFIQQWKPLLDVSPLPVAIAGGGTFDAETRINLGENSMHLRYNKWQLYRLQGAGDDTVQPVLGLWGLVEYNVTSIQQGDIGQEQPISCGP